MSDANGEDVTRAPYWRDGRTLVVEPEHVGRHVWLNSAELVWECDDDCPHGAHDG